MEKTDFNSHTNPDSAELESNVSSEQTRQDHKLSADNVFLSEPDSVSRPVPEIPKKSAESSNLDEPNPFSLVIESSSSDEGQNSDDSVEAAGQEAQESGAPSYEPHPLTIRTEEIPENLTSIGSDRSRLEAVLFLAKEPWNTRRLAQYAQIEDGSRVRRLIRELNESYLAGRYPYRIVGVAGGFQLMTRPQFWEWLRRIHRSRASRLNLSPTAMETLTIIAYKQPVLRVDIESVRGFQCGEMLRSLMDRDLVRIVDRSDDLGRPYLYGTTKKFLTEFGLNSLDDLPKLADH